MWELRVIGNFRGAQMRIDPLVLFKMLMIQQFSNLSDEEP
jgi:hypothetical protein